jgi:hypothetical protein
VVAEFHAEVEKDSDNLGFQGMDLDSFNNNEVIGKIFLQLTFSDWTEKLEILNTAIKTQQAHLHWSSCWCSRIWNKRDKPLKE